MFSHIFFPFNFFNYSLQSVNQGSNFTIGFFFVMNRKVSVCKELLQFSVSQVCLPDCFSANQKLKHTHEGIIKMFLVYWQSWSINHLLRTSVPVFVHPTGKDIFLNVQLEPPQVQLCAFPPQRNADREEVVYFPSFLQIRQHSCSQLLITALLQALLH